MRAIASITLGWLLVGEVALAQPAATLGTPIAHSPRVRGQSDETPMMAVPEPATLGTPGYYSGPPTAQYPPQPYYYYPPPPPGYYPPPAAVDPLVSSAPTGKSTLPGDPVRRTSFSSRTSEKVSISRAGEVVSETYDSCCDWLKGCFCNDGRTLFESDHCLDIFASPVTNPFLFEDPRSLTEIKPLFIYQKIPSGNSLYQGGTIYFYGFTGSLALTDRWSITLNKVGGVTLNPASSSGQPDESGLAEIHLGPKFTFIRNSDTGTAAALGAIFQIPTGSAKVAQDTGDLSIVPYISFAKNFGRSSYGGFNFMDTSGFALDVGSGRSEYFYSSFHLDYDIANLHRFYPLLELNWFHYTKSGGARPVNFEGRDIANIGATNVSHDFLTLAPGFRWKFTECAQFGFATEFPISNPKDLQDFRLTVDLIIRY